MTTMTNPPIEYMNTTDQILPQKSVPQKGHIATACKAIAKQIEKYELEIHKLEAKQLKINKLIEERQKEIEGLAEQILKLKG